MRKKLLSIIAGSLAFCGLVQAQDVSIPLISAGDGWSWSETMTQGATNPNTTAGVGCSAATVAKFALTGYAAIGFNTSDASWTPYVSDWIKYDKVEFLIYSDVAGSLKADVGIKGYTTGNVEIDALGALSPVNLVANEWQVVTFVIPAVLIDKDGVTHTSLSDATLNLNHFVLQTGFDAGNIYIGGITVKEKSAIAPTSISIAPSSVSMITGKSFALTPTIAPSNASLSLNYESNAIAATVDNGGNVTSVSAGAATITAKSAIAPTILGSSTVTVTNPNTADSKVYADFDYSNPFASVWAATVSTATSTIVANPSKTTDNLSDKVLYLNSFLQWEAASFTKIDVNKLNKITWWVYSATAISDFTLKVGLNTLTDKTISTPLTAGTWTKMTWDISNQVLSPITDNNVFYIQNAANGSSTTGYSFYVDNIQLVAGSDFYAINSFKVQGANGATKLPLADATLQMEAKNLLPANATNQSLVWSVSDATVATINAATGLLTAVKLGTVSVSAQADGGGVKDSVVITIAKSSDATLKALSVSAGTISPAFSKTTLAYTVTLPSGTATVPANIISAAATSTLATVTITQPTTVAGQGTIAVTAEDGTVSTYTVTLQVAAATNADLSTLSVDPGSLTFAANTTTYAVTIPYATTAVAVTFVTSDALATAVKSGDGITSNTIVVTAADGITTKTYTINYTKAAAETVSTLSSVTTTGTLAPAFAAGVTSYVVTLPAGTTAVPTITPTKTGTFSTVVVTLASTVAGTSTVVVTAQSGASTTYSFTYHVVSDNSALASLKLNNSDLISFSAGIKTYNVELAAGTTTAPTVTAVAASTLATVAVTNATSSTGSATVKVTAEDGSISTYTIHFSVAKTLVTGITVSGAASATTITVKGATLQMSVAVLPAGATDKTVTWSVSDPSIATINATTGLLTPVADGTVTVTATANDASGVTDTQVITITNQTTGFGDLKIKTITQRGNKFSFDGSAKMINILGKVVLTGVNGIDASSLNAGIYFIVIDGKTKEVSVK
jgi:uncharacterized protein YjdB